MSHSKTELTPKSKPEANGHGQQPLQYQKPDVHDLGRLEQVQGGVGPRFDGSGSDLYFFRI
jgi:hypothetical protein